MNEIITLTGPTCSGKTTLERALVAAGVCIPVRSHTTRLPRSGETDADYHFVSKAAFRDMVEKGEFAEYNYYADNGYGTSTEELKRQLATGLPVVKIVEPIGMANIATWAAKAGAHHVPIYLTHTPAKLAERLLNRSHAELVRIAAGDVEARAAFARRLALMMTVERQWDQTASVGSSGFSMYAGTPYRLVINHAGDNTEADIKTIQYALGMARRRERRADK